MGKLITWIVVVVVIVGGIWWFVSSRPNETGSPLEEQAESMATSTPEVGESTIAASTTPTVTITYDGKAFTPPSVTVHVGDTVTFVDASSKPMWVASGVHPSHTVYDGTTREEHCAANYTGPTPFDECQASADDYSFTFTKAGTWPFHDHANATVTGKVIVQ